MNKSSNPRSVYRVLTRLTLDSLLKKIFCNLNCRWWKCRLGCNSSSWPSISPLGIPGSVIRAVGNVLGPAKGPVQSLGDSLCGVGGFLY